MRYKIMEKLASSPFEKKWNMLLKTEAILFEKDRHQLTIQLSTLQVLDGNLSSI